MIRCRQPPACPHAYSPFFKVWWWEWEHELRLSVPLGGKSNFHPASLTPQCTEASPRAESLAALCELNHVQVAPHHDCFIHAQLVASSPAGLIVEAFTDPERDPLQAELYEDAPEIKDGHHQTLRCSRFGLDAEWECHREVWHAHPVDVTSASGQDLRPSATFCDLQRPIDGLVMTGHWSVLHHPFLGTLMLCIPTEWKTRCCAVPIAFCQGFFRCGENWKNYHPVNLREPIP